MTKKPTKNFILKTP